MSGHAAIWGCIGWLGFALAGAGCSVQVSGDAGGGGGAPNPPGGGGGAEVGPSCGGLSWRAELAFASITDLKTDGAGNTYVVGYTQDNPITFGATTIGASLQGFIGKIDAAGNAVSAIDLGDAAITLVTIDRDDHLVLCLDFDHHLKVAGQSFTGLQEDFVVLALDGDQNILWSRTFGGHGPRQMQALNTDPATGDVLVGGEFSGVLELGTTTLTAPSGGSGLMLRLAAGTGEVAWALDVPGDGPAVLEMSASPSGSTVVNGVDFGTAAIGGQAIANHGGKDHAWIAAIDASGAVEWARVICTDDMCDPAVGVAADGTIYVSGATTRGVDLGGAKFEVAPGEYYTGFVGRLDAAGNALWLRKLATDSPDTWAFALRPDGTSVAAGEGGGITVEGVQVSGQFFDVLDANGTSLCLLTEPGWGGSIPSLDARGLARLAIDMPHQDSVPKVVVDRVSF